jgi:signal recognition particle subunit SRP19
MTMKKQETTILWPVYFDSSRTRSEGRKLPKNLAVSNLTLAELQAAAARLGLHPEIEADTAHSAIPWRKTGRIRIQKRHPKMQALAKIAKEVASIRREARD